MWKEEACHAYPTRKAPSEERVEATKGWTQMWIVDNCDGDLGEIGEGLGGRSLVHKAGIECRRTGKLVKLVWPWHRATSKWWETCNASRRKGADTWDPRAEKREFPQSSPPGTRPVKDRCNSGRKRGDCVVNPPKTGRVRYKREGRGQRRLGLMQRRMRAEEGRPCQKEPAECPLWVGFRFRAIGNSEPEYRY